MWYHIRNMVKYIIGFLSSRDIMERYRYIAQQRLSIGNIHIAALHQRIPV
jgi:hypothetical protein